MRKALLIVLGTTLVAAGALLTPASGSSPTSSTIAVPGTGGKTVSASYTGTIPPGATPPNTDLASDCTTEAGVTSDAHTVVVKAPSAGYTKVTAEFIFTITWDTVVGVDSDEILTLVAPNGSSITSSDGGDPKEQIVIDDLPSGKYKLLACGFSNAAPKDYDGKITVKTVKKAASPSGGPTHTVNDNLMTFTPPTIVDPILFGGEPGITFDPTTNGHRLFADWPVSSRTNIGVLFRSTDGGLSFQKRYADVTDAASDGPACLGRQVPYCPTGGGGDTDVEINPTNGNVYFSSQESLANQAVGTSFNHGRTFPAAYADPVIHKTGGDVDRQWLGSWAGTKTEFLAFHSPIVGEYIARSDQAGATGSWSIPGTPQIPFVAQSGALEVDNTGGRHNRTLYVAYNSDIPNASDVLHHTFHVGVSTDGAKTFTSYELPGANNADDFTKIYLDTKGNLYAVFTDTTTHGTYLLTSNGNVGKNRTAPGSVWKGPYLVSASPADITIFPDVRAGSPGRIGVIYYGSDAVGPTPDDVTPGSGGWYPYLAVSTNAMCMWDSHPCKSPRFHQMRVQPTINHDDNICTAGTTCLATGGNRNLLDYWDIDIDAKGHLGFIWGDTRNGIGLPYVKVARQASGPSLYKGKPDADRSLRGNAYPDARGDARFPFAGNQVVTAKNHPTLDLRGTSVRVNGSRLEFRIKLTKATGLGAGVPTGNDGATPLQQAKYLVRWEQGHNVYYAGANVPAGGRPSYFSGRVSKAEGISSGANPDSLNGFGNIYSALGPASGRVRNGALVIDVPRSAVGSPKVGTNVYSVGTYAMVGPQDNLVVLQTLPVTVDSSPTFDTTLSTSAAPTTGVPGTPGGEPGNPGSTEGGTIATTGLPVGLTITGLVLLAAAAFGRRVSVVTRTAGPTRR